MEITDYHAKYFANELTRLHPSGDLEGLIPTLMNAQVDLNPHQIEAALFAFNSPLSKGAILADEVGLGKTIEAGILLSQKWAERKRKILIVVPASLRKQWNRELWGKFLIPSCILETKSFNSEIKEGKSNPFQQDKVVICSYQFAKNKSTDATIVKWDLVIIDEAHRLRNVYKKDNKIARCLRNAFKGIPKILLTATPLQNSLMELYGLVSFIDEYAFGDFESFKAQYSGGLKGGAYDNLKKRLMPICKRNLRRQVKEYVSYTNRIPLTQDFTPEAKEQLLYDKISEYLQRPNIQSLPPKGRQLVIMVLRKLLASSTFAIAGALNTIINRLKGILKDILNDNLDDDLKNDFEALEDIEDEWVEVDDILAPSQNQREALEKEIEELEKFYGLATSIEENAKGEALVTALSFGFKKANEIGASKRAIIFTESKRTQEYILRRLEQTEYKEKVVLFNGSNNDQKSRDIYNTWFSRNKNSDTITGSRTADMRSALVDCFKNDAQIMIATEAASEGINLQFCSLVINYDLPWNPQRIEQRIGRCHRYSQKHDVVVINFLNKKNAADKRVFELLEKKFKLFEGVFGASDEVLGTIESGVNFEKRIFEIYQQCRTDEEIQKAFDGLQNEMSSYIEEGIKVARQNLIENFDEEVVEKLKVSNKKSKEYLQRHENWLWEISKHIVGKHATFKNDSYTFNLHQNHHFEGDGIPLGPYKMGQNIEGVHFYRPQHPLAQKILEQAINANTPFAYLTFNYGHPSSPKITILEDLINCSGYLVLVKISVNSFDREEHLMFSAITDKGRTLDKEQGQRLFSLPAKVEPSINGSCFTIDLLKSNCNNTKESILQDIEQKNGEFFEEQEEKLDIWAKDKELSLKDKLKQIEKEIKKLKKEKKQAGSVPEKMSIAKKIIEIEKEKDKEWKQYEEAKKDIEDQKESLIEQVETQMKLNTKEELIFKIKWKVI